MRATVTACLLVLAVMTAPALAGDRVIARVGSEPITSSELSAALSQSPDLTREEALKLLVERRLVLVWASGQNISVDDEELEKLEASIRDRNNLTPEQFEQALRSNGESLTSFRATLREQLTINKALGKALSSRVQVTDDELQELYHQTYSAQTVFEVSHILFPLGEDAPPEGETAAREKAETVLGQLDDGASFSELAAAYSGDPSSAGNGGRLGRFHRGELLPELEELIDTLEPGQTGGPVRTQAGFHILLLESLALSDPPSFSEVREELERTLLARKEESVRTRWLEELRETTYVEVFPDDR